MNNSLFMRLYGQTVPSASFTVTHWVSKKVEWLFKFLRYITASKMREIIYTHAHKYLCHNVSANYSILYLFNPKKMKWLITWLTGLFLTYLVMSTIFINQFWWLMKDITIIFEILQTKAATNFI